MTDKNLFEIVDGRLVSFNGKHDVQGTLVIPAEVTCIGEEALRGSDFRHVRFLGNVTKIEKRAFATCSKLESIEIPQGVKTIEEEVLNDCEQLRWVYIPDGVEEIDAFAFSYDVSLKGIDIPASVKKIDPSAFTVTSNLSEINVDEKNEAYMSIDGNLYTRDGKTLVRAKTVATHVDIPDGVTEIADYAFWTCNITGVKIPDGVKKIGDSVFCQCLNLKSADIPSSVTSIGRSAFFGCTFASLKLPEKLESIGNNAFESSCLESISLPEGLKSVGKEAFSSCRRLKSVTIPRTVTYIGRDAFSHCRLLERIDVEDGSENFKSMDGNLYYVYDEGIVLGVAAAAKRQKTFAVPDGVCMVADFSFAVYSRFLDIEVAVLERVSLPEGVTRVGRSAYDGCSALKSMVLPRSLKVIDEWALDGCESLESVFYAGTKEDWEKIAIGYGNDALEAATVYFYSEAEPGEEGNFWRYVGGEPAMW